MRPANASVDRPIQPASGMIAIAETMNSAVGCVLKPNGHTKAIGTKIRIQFADDLSFTAS